MLDRKKLSVFCDNFLPKKKVNNIHIVSSNKVLQTTHAPTSIEYFTTLQIMLAWY